MSNRGLQTFGDGYPKIMEPVQPNHSMWMNRLKTTSCNPSLHGENQFHRLDENREDCLDMEEGERFAETSEPRHHTRLDINATPCNISEYRNSWRCQRAGMIVAATVPQSAKAVEVVTEAQRVDITYETLGTNSRDLGIPRLQLQPSVFKFSQNKGNILGQKRLAVSIEHESITQTDDISTRGAIMNPSNFQFFSKALGSAPTDTSFQLEEYRSQPESRLQCQKQVVKPFSSLDRNSLPVLKDKLAGSRFVPNSQGASIEPIKNADMTVFVCDKKKDNYISMKSGNPHRLKSDGAMQLNEPSTSNFCLPLGDGEPGNRTCEFISNVDLPSHSRHTQQKNRGEMNNGHYFISDVPRPVLQLGEGRLPSSVSSVQSLSRGPRFSPINDDHLSINDVSKPDQILSASTVSPKLKASASHGRFTLLPGFDCHDKCREKLTPLGSPRNSEGENNERTASLASNNESSAETDIMDINVYPAQNSLPSISSSPSYKDMMSGIRPAKSHSTISRPNQLPDINQDPPSCLAAEQEPTNMDLSTSRTESLDAENIRFDSSPSPRPQKSDDPSSRWVKRLKLSSPDFAHGTKVDSLHKNPTSLSPLDPMDLDLNKPKESIEGVSLDHPWIQRWCRNKEPRGEMKMELSERGGSKVELCEYQTKQFPSIAAMALMGKTMTGLQSCKFQNKGSFFVWGKGGANSE